MKILIVGGGGREHALAWKCAQPPYIKKVFCAPGNAGTALEQKVVNVPIEAENIIELAAFAEAENIDLTIVGPEGPLVMGIVDTFRVRGLLCFGPTKSAAILENQVSQGEILDKSTFQGIKKISPAAVNFKKCPGLKLTFDLFRERLLLTSRHFKRRRRRGGTLSKLKQRRLREAGIDFYDYNNSPM